MIRYGIVISIDDIFTIEAAKEKMDKKKFMLQILENGFEDEENEDEEQKEIEKEKAVREFKNDPMGTLWCNRWLK